MAEQNEHRRQFIESFAARLGDHVPPVRRQDVRGDIARRAVWQVRALGVDAMRPRRDADRFNRRAAGRSTDVGTRKLLADLAEAEAVHERAPGRAARSGRPAGRVGGDAGVRVRGSFAPDSWTAFKVGLAASLDAGISMGFAEALADDGKPSGRGTPRLRGPVCGLITVAGGIAPRSPT